jgi:hypothetical protein
LKKPLTFARSKSREYTYVVFMQNRYISHFHYTVKPTLFIAVRNFHD